MGEYVAASIRVGGTLPATLAAEFLVALTGDRESNSAAADRLRGMLDDGVLFYDEGEVPWGEFEDAELFCQQHDLSYVRDTDGSRAIQAHRRYWQPGMRKPRYVDLDLSGYEMLSQSEVSACLDELEARMRDHAGDVVVWSVVLGKLRALCHTDIELPPFVIE